MALTDAGATYLALCEPLLDGFDELEERVKNEQASLRGVIHISAPTGFGALRLAPSLVRFAEKHPNVELDLQFSDRRVSIIEEGIDLAIRIGPMRDSSLKMRQLGRMPLVVCASPAYLQRAGTPAHPRTLATHECILDGNMTEPTVWRFDIDGQEEAVQVNGRFRMSAPAGSARIAAAGAAIARCPAYTVAEALKSGELVELLPTTASHPMLWPRFFHITGTSRHACVRSLITSRRIGCYALMAHETVLVDLFVGAIKLPEIRKPDVRLMNGGCRAIRPLTK